ncbi:MAG: hypothetical protein HS116_02230 [Planctomycetes bacterium]|nr:hypothetical protein [Planctomycetota bacterium]
MAGEEQGLSKEGREIVDLFCEKVGAKIDRNNIDMREQLARTESKISEQVKDLREEFKEDMRDLKDSVAVIQHEQSELRKGQEAQGKDLVEIRTRLNEGDKRFEAHDNQIKELQRKDEEKGKTLAKAAGAVGLAGAVIGYLLKYVKGP